jgi:septal ring factor EnvC (AmiA/AmiB activator)
MVNTRLKASHDKGKLKMARQIEAVMGFYKTAERNAREGKRRIEEQEKDLEAERTCVGSERERLKAREAKLNDMETSVADIRNQLDNHISMLANQTEGGNEEPRAEVRDIQAELEAMIRERNWYRSHFNSLSIKFDRTENEFCREKKLQAISLEGMPEEFQKEHRLVKQIYQDDLNRALGFTYGSPKVTMPRIGKTHFLEPTDAYQFTPDN